MQDVCQLAAAACGILSDACGGAEGVHPAPPPPCMAAVGRFALPYLRLSNAVLCSADVAARLVGAGQHAAAADGAKAGVKHLVAALDALSVRHLAGDPAQQQHEQQQQQDQRELCGTLAAACELLLELALAATALTTGEGPAGAPREMASLAVLNLGWNSLGKLMAPARVAPPEVVRRAAAATLQQLVRSSGELRAPGSEGRLRLVRFWLGVALKVVGASPAVTRAVAWDALVSACMALHAADRAGFAPHESVAASAVRELVLPKLSTAMLSALNEPGVGEDELAACLQQIAAAAEDGGGKAGGSQPPRLSQQQQAAPLPHEANPVLRLQVGLLLAGTLLQQAPAMQPALAHAAARSLLPWLVRAAGAGAAGALLSEHPGGLWQHVRCAALAFVLGCAAGGAPFEAAWRSGMEALQLLGEFWCPGLGLSIAWIYIKWHGQYNFLALGQN
jgi:hypothetical protein